MRLKKFQQNVKVKNYLLKVKKYEHIKFFTGIGYNFELY